MSDEDDDAPEEEVEEGAAWLATFADLMSLLMCFFVLLLSFSEMDLEKYRQIAGSLRMAFGVQRVVEAPEPPKGTSVIAQEFSPGRPDPTALKIMRQQGNDQARKRVNIVASIERQLDTQLEKLREALSMEIEQGRVEVVRTDDEVVVRISESESFASGSAKLRTKFYATLDKIAEAMASTTGRLIVAGHTDDVPISTEVYPSNWVLSSARAASVVHYFADSTLFDGNQIEIRAYADTRPLKDNDTRENRAVNRRVEVIVSHADYLQGLRQIEMPGPLPPGVEPPLGPEEEPTAAAAQPIYGTSPRPANPVSSMLPGYGNDFSFDNPVEAPEMDYVPAGPDMENTR